MRLINMTLAATLIFGACTADSETTTGSERQGSVEQLYAKLPIDHSNYECQVSETEPTFCDWLKLSDQLVKIEVLGSGPVFAPSWGVNVRRMIEDCPYDSEPVFEIRARVQETYGGTLSTGEEIEIRVPSHWYSNWEPRLSIEPQTKGGTLEWHLDDPDNSDRGIDEGTEFVVALIKADSVYSMGTHRPIEVSDDGGLSFARSTNECLMTYHPVSTLPSSIDSLGSAQKEVPRLLYRWADILLWESRVHHRRSSHIYRSDSN